MSTPSWNQKAHEYQQKLAGVLENLQSLNIKFKNGNPNALTATLFNVNEHIITGNITDSNVGQVIQNTVIGSVLPSNVCTSVYSTDSYFFVGTNAGVWIYDRINNTGITIDITVTITGDNLPSNDIMGVFYDEYRYILYVATNGGGIWIYNLVTGIGTTINTSTIVLGDALANNIVFSIAVDLVNNILYAGTQHGLWKYIIATNTGKDFSSTGGASSGDQLTGSGVSVTVDYINNSVWVGTSSGLWRYNNSNGNGKIYDISGGAGSGQQLPNNWTWIIYFSISTDTLFAGTANGVWAYNIATDTGMVINTATPVMGDPLPSNNDSVVWYNDATNNLYVGTDTGVWILDLTSMTGKVYNTTTIPSAGPALPLNMITRLWADTNGYLSVTTYGGGLWILNIAADSTELFQASTPGANTLPSNIVWGITTCESQNVMYAATLSGMFQWFVNTQIGKVFTSSGGAGHGDQMPSSICTSIYYDQTHNVVYVGTFLGLWRYNVGTDTGKTFTAAGGAGHGDQLPYNFVYGVSVDEANEIVYVATANGFWIYNTGTDTGKTFTTAGGAGSGDQLPNNGSTDCAYYPNSNYVWVITNGGGLWQYDEILDIGKTYNMVGGAGHGQQMPDNTGWSIALESDVVWVATNAGIWQYKISTDIGHVINNLTPVTSGDKLPEPFTLGVSIDSFNQILWVGCENYGVWQYQISIDTGRIYDSSGGQSAGTGLPANNVQSIFYDATNSNLWAATRGGGIWQYILNNQGVIGSSFINLSTSVYNYISQTLDIAHNPIMIFMMKITITGSPTFNNIIKYIGNDMFGVGYGRVIKLGDYISALTNHIGDMVDVPIPEGILVSKDYYFEYPLDPLEEVDMIIYYVRLNMANLLRRQLSLIEFGRNQNPLEDDLN